MEKQKEKFWKFRKKWYKWKIWELRKINNSNPPIVPTNSQPSSLYPPPLIQTTKFPKNANRSDICFIKTFSFSMFFSKMFLWMKDTTICKIDFWKVKKKQSGILWTCPYAMKFTLLLLWDILNEIQIYSIRMDSTLFIIPKYNWQLTKRGKSCTNCKQTTF